MRRWLAVLGCAIVIGGCQTPLPEPTHPRDHTVVIHPGDAAVSVVGTPFYLAFKTVVCMASVAIAAPVAGLAALSESRFAPEIRRDLGDGVNQNCGPPYVLSPYRVVSVDPTPEVTKTPAPGLRSELPIGVPDVPAPPPSLEPPPGMPAMATPAQPLEPASDSPAPTTEEFPEPAAGGPIELFKRLRRGGGGVLGLAPLVVGRYPFRGPGGKRPAMATEGAASWHHCAGG
jgi:hypothetical protein